MRSMVLLAQLIKVPDRDELILDALRLLAKQDIEYYGYNQQLVIGGVYYVKHFN